MKIDFKETIIHILIWIVLFLIVFFSVILWTKKIQYDIWKIRIDVNEIANQLEIDLYD